MRERIAPAPMLPGETLGRYRAINGDERARRQDEAWAADQVAPFPLSWCARLLDSWRGRRGFDRATANGELLQRAASVRAAQRAGVRADAADADLRDEADKSARDMARQLDLGERLVLNPHPVVATTARLWAAAAWLEGRGLGDAWERAQRAARSARAALARVVCARWWRLVLRRLHARAVESVARGLGLVHKRAGCYVSEDSARRRRGQLVRNVAALESVEAVNDRGQSYTLAELAAKGPANREIRRHELMTRIAGFELIARDLSHEALFVTVTCPSRMHAWRTKPGQGYSVEANPKHDGTTPEAAQQYLTKQWARFRAAADRRGVELYGFRIAEPNHDGTPHWHALLFIDPEVKAGTIKNNPRAGRQAALRVVLRLLRRYFLRNDPGANEVRGMERGARVHRVKVERIDWARGSAAGYVAKYVAKNIDGYKVGRDLYGNEAMESSQRVDAWAATWRIRQFQQVGGAPVGVWRELRRMHPDQERAGLALGLVLDAVNVASSAPEGSGEAVERYTAATGWQTYVELQGGHKVRRSALRFRLHRVQTGELGRYGDPVVPRVEGVSFAERARIGVVESASVRVAAESERCEWSIGRKGRGALARSEAPRPWSPVNNCTRLPLAVAQELAAGASMFVRTVPKLGRFPAWGRAKPTEEPPPCRTDTPKTLPATHASC